MFHIDKKRFGAFAAALRKEKGITQRQLSEQLSISDKAISKWETGVSLPDTALLIPLAEILEVSVTELLMCERIGKDDKLNPDRVEDIVKTAVTYPEERPERAYHGNRQWILWYGLSALLCLAGMGLNRMTARHGLETLTTMVFLSAVFGGYFCCLVRMRLPRFYDENRVSIFCDGPIRMNIPGVVFHNRNWPHIVKALRLWLCLCMVCLPVINLLAGFIAADAWEAMGPFVLMGIFFCALFLPVYAAGRKYA